LSEQIFKRIFPFHSFVLIETASVRIGVLLGVQVMQIAILEVGTHETVLRVGVIEDLLLRVSSVTMNRALPMAIIETFSGIGEVATVTVLIRNLPLSILSVLPGQRIAAVWDTPINRTASDTLPLFLGSKHRSDTLVYEVAILF
jgi:hypothetical protein